MIKLWSKVRYHSYIINLLIALDQVLAALFGYNSDWTVSAMLGEKQIKLYGGGNIPWSRPLDALLQRALDKIQKDHCKRSYYSEVERARMTAQEVLYKEMDNDIDKEISKGAY